MVASPSYKPDLSDNMLAAVHSATLQLLADMFPKAPLPLWKKPLQEIEMGYKLQVTIEHVAKGIRQHETIFPLDPVWVVSQIMAESFFYDGAVSSAMAVGLCQIIPATARENGLLVALDKPEHRFAPYAKPERSGALHAYEQVVKERQRILRQERPKQELTQDEAVRAIAENKIEPVLKRAKDTLAWKNKLKELDETLKNLRAECREYLEANFSENGGADPVRNSAFFLEFDHRFVHERCIPVMVSILAKNLQKRNGNILSAAAGYNAGLSTTSFEEKFYAPYGRIPAFEETTRYISRIVGNYHEIYNRIALIQ